MNPRKCLRNSDSVAVLYIGAADQMRDWIDRNIHAEGQLSIDLTDYGFIISLNEIGIPVQESMFEHLAATGLVRVYCAQEEEYELSLIYNLPIPQELVQRAIGAYAYRAGSFG